ncbi:hypothetical protein HanXRQr2_Chr14g0632131 [Helianthus annuus]|uniref:Uncharacterized protein n=1 Tax=Helianthus annuus TaxID=4232 RepID=A0A251SEC4_HELAN|nr:hypothetical protein HanXRQr2_Chr14g0632131 [Helianthus annuus]KAJ0484877.1 hypothetical protein HanHA89_Chr14g0561781 [Helianthus annuus]KAJ0655427.1 hypothetical protein HanLR1_Chr14g0524101 [Helianthus annuus]KAJ0659122.1 hypothetical protein HanOQP8_Chr14g0522441 [Helianthus annuus]KAJ0839395.1 hypothetical protein HanPSC8_Chr14g0606291 [Helianthus annuus]
MSYPFTCVLMFQLLIFHLTCPSHKRYAAKKKEKQEKGIRDREHREKDMRKI